MSTPIAPTNFQGIPIDPQGVNPAAFFSLTRRKRAVEQARTFAGLTGVDNLSIRKSDILSIIRLRFSGSLLVTPGAGTVATTAQWPHNLNKNTKLTANGQTNLIDASGLHLKVREFMVTEDLNDRGVIRSVNGANVQQATLSKNAENWGVGQSQTAIGAGTYPVELEWVIPVAEDEKDLSGAIFAQTSSMDINLQVQWANVADLFALTSNAAVTLTGTVIMETEKYSIPVSSGIMIVPDLSLFHSIIQTNTNAVTNGANDVKLIGQGSGKQLLRMWARVLNGTGVAAVPLAVNAVNYGPQAWKYGTSETPETYQDGQSIRLSNEWAYGTDIAGVWGVFAHEFAVTNAYRDTVDMGQTSELRLSSVIQNAVTLTTPLMEYVQETVFAAGS